MNATVDVIRDVRRFAALRSEWNVLLRASRSCSPFLTWEWLHSWWVQFGDPGALFLVTVRSQGQLIGIAPLRVTRQHMPGLARLEFLGTGEAGSDYLDFIVHSGRESDVVPLLAGTVASHSRPVYLRNLPVESVARLAAMELSGSGWSSRERVAGVCPHIPLGGHSWESFLATLGPAHRANVRRRLNALSRRYTMQFEQALTDSRRHEVLQTLMTLHNRRWSRRGGSTAFSSPALRAFHDDVTRRALAAGWLRLWSLSLNGQIAAAMYAFAYDRRVYFYQHGFDDRYEHDSPGLVLMALAIRAAIDEGAVDFDLLYGDEGYKTLWARDRRQLARLELFPAHLGGVIQRRASDADRALRQFARRFLIRAAS